MTTLQKKLMAKRTPAATAPAVAAAPRNAVRPIPVHDVDTMLTGFDVVNPTAALPDLDRLTIDVQGAKGSGKSSLIAGNPRAIIAKFPDGAPAYRRCRATVVNVRSLDDFNRLVDKVKNMAARDGVNGRYCTFAIDPVYILVQWLLEVELQKANDEGREQFDRDLKYGRLPAGSLFVPYSHIRDVANSNMRQFPKVGEIIGALGNDIRAMGWGFQTCTHYQLRFKAEGRVQGSEWLPDIPGSSATQISKYSDILAVTKKIPVDSTSPPIYGVFFQHDKIECIGGRVPLVGSITIPDLNDRNTTLTTTPWDMFVAAYNEARDLYHDEQARFMTTEAGDVAGASE